MKRSTRNIQVTRSLARSTTSTSWTHRVQSDNRSRQKKRIDRFFFHFCSTEFQRFVFEIKVYIIRNNFVTMLNRIAGPDHASSCHVSDCLLRWLARWLPNNSNPNNENCVTRARHGIVFHRWPPFRRGVWISTNVNKQPVVWIGMRRRKRRYFQTIRSSVQNHPKRIFEKIWWRIFCEKFLSSQIPLSQSSFL